MTVLVRLRRDLLASIHVDLSRSHAFAAERVGFLFCRIAKLPSSLWLAMATEYMPVADGDYVYDDHVGARIGGDAIRRAMQHVLDTGQAAFHVHRHDHEGEPWFSSIDRKALSELMPTFCGVASEAAHGGIVLSLDEASATAWVEGDQQVSARVSIIGYPTQIRRGRDGL